MSKVNIRLEIRRVLEIYGIDTPPAGMVGALAFLLETTKRPEAKP